MLVSMAAAFSIEDVLHVQELLSMRRTMEAQERKLELRFEAMAAYLAHLANATQQESESMAALTSLSMRQASIDQTAICAAECSDTSDQCHATYLSENIVGGPGVYYCCTGDFLVAGAVGCICDNGLNCQQLSHVVVTVPPVPSTATPTPTPTPTATAVVQPVTTPPPTTVPATPIIIVVLETPVPPPPFTTPSPVPAPPPSTVTTSVPEQTVTPAPPSTTSPSSAEPSPSSSLQALGLRALEYTNEFRAQNGLGPLGYNQGLYVEALAWSQYMARTGVFRDQDLSHPIVPVPAGIVFSGENVAFYTEAEHVARECINLFISSPPHRANMLGDYELCSVAFAQNTAGAWYCTQCFGNIFRTP
ncbi:hypothetical protein CCYA_CCYA10G2855 [Cyanidiococcus yangmingshanensis]|nr:hypothetical protein CCYA_CCYA10G2855 [Cyanidiococcus yangmingshanensis]